MAKEIKAIKTEGGEVVATNVDRATTFLSKARGLMFRRTIPDNYALVFDFPRQKRVNLHMFFVPFDIDAVFLDSENTVTKTSTLSAWTGLASGEASRVVELPKGNSKSLKKGETLVFETQEDISDDISENTPEKT